MQPQDDCKACADDIERVVVEAQTQWQKLDSTIAEAEDAFLASRLPRLRKWFGVEEEDLANWTPGSLRSTVRHRVQVLLVAPVLERMEQRVAFEPPGEDFESVHVLALLLNHHKTCVKPLVEEAKEADVALTKKIKKTEKEERAKGIVALGMQDTKRVAALKRERPQIWDAVRAALEAYVTPVRHLKAFLTDELSPDMLSCKAGAVPVVASRAICDWYFQRSLIEYQQLQEWWRKSKATLQQRERLWKRLMDREGILIRRIEAGMDDVGSRKTRYTMYANFGGSEMEVMHLLSASTVTSAQGGALPPKLEESVNLLSMLVSEVSKRLKAIRDSAIWRVIDTARSIHRELSEEDSGAEAPPWKAASTAAGAAALLQELGWGQDDAGNSGARTDEVLLLDAAVAVMRRLEQLSALVTDTRDFWKEHAANGPVAILDELVLKLRGNEEDLLSLMDEPSKATARGWLQQWDSLFASAPLGQQLEHAVAGLPLKPDSELGTKARVERRHWLLLTRGLQVFLEDEAMRNQVMLPLVRVAEPRSARGSSSARPAALASSRRAPATEPQEGGVDAILALSTPPSPRVLPGLGSGGYPQRSSQSSIGTPHSRGPDAPTPNGGSSSSFAAAWRPDTPSTSCEEQAGAKPAVSKFVDGQYISMRPGSPAVRLSPLSGKSRKVSLASLGLELPP